MNNRNFVDGYLRNKKMPTWENCLLLMVLAVGVYSLYIAVSYAAQLPLERHSFRQTKSALVAYWLIQNGYGLAYETPVVGPPWTVPFAFPIYQHIVAIISDVFGTPLDPTGRMVSYLFLMACLVPARSIINKLQLHGAVFYIFVVLVLSSPQYLFWGRTFTMETTALFFSLAAVKYFVDAITDGFNRKNIILFAIFMSLGLLQKLTTAIPVLGTLSMIYFLQEAREWYATRTIPWIRITGIGLVCFLLPFMVGMAWVLFTDQMKMRNDFGAELLALSDTLLQRNVLGALEMRYSKDLLFGVIGERILKDNFGGVLGLFIVSLALIQLKSIRMRFVVLATSFLGFLPLFLFPYLHIEHDYYQTANIIYLLFALAVSLWYVVFSKIGKMGALFLLALLVAWNYAAFAAPYYKAVTLTKEDFHGRRKSPVAIGEILKEELPKDGQFVAFGDDWAPRFSYMSQRKSFTIPLWYSGYSTVLANPEQFLDEEKFGAAVYCIDDAPHANSLFGLVARKSWKVGSTHGCLIAASDPGISTTSPQTQTTECAHGIDVAEVEHRHGTPLISLAGWILPRESAPHAAADRFYFAISHSEEIVKYIGALAVHRSDINKQFSLDYYENVGLSALAPVDVPAGSYSVNILRANDDQVEICKKSVPLSIEEGDEGR